MMKALGPSVNELSELLTFERTTDPENLLRSLSGEFADDMTKIFPGQWAWAALAFPRSTQQIWCSILSGPLDLPPDCSRLRANLLSLDQGLMLRLRFGNVGDALGKIVSRLERNPLPKIHYDPLAEMLKSDLTIAEWYDARSGPIHTEDLEDHIVSYINQTTME
jgi:hypothetical protein